jgi:putative transposase
MEVGDARSVLEWAVRRALGGGPAQTGGHCEQLVGTPRRELLDRVLILGERHLHAVLAEYQAHYNMARPHQGIAQHVPEGEHDSPRSAETRLDSQRIRPKAALNGLINEYTRAA